MNTQIDHLFYGTHNLEQSIDELEQLLGVRATFGGSHPGWGTKNYLLALGPESYLEIIGPDEEQDITPTLFGLDKLTSPGLITWDMKSDDLEGVRTKMIAADIRFGEILSGSRHKADGSLLSWRLSNPFIVHAKGIVPFLIDWGGGPHPAAQCPKGCTLLKLELLYPKVNEIEPIINILSLDVRPGPQPSIKARIESPNGIIELR